MTPGTRAPLATTDVDDPTRWALRARDGDQGAAAALIRSTRPEVWRFVAGLTDAGEADDLTQETYLRALRALPAFEGRCSARTWLFSIARRTCADRIRAGTRERRLLARAARVDGAGESAEDASATIGAAELLGRLSPARRTAFVLTQVLGLSYAEAAGALEVPIGTIRSRVARARADLVAAVERVRAV